MINLAKLKVGDHIELPLYPERTPLPGKVIYIHPRRRFFRVRFDTPHGPVVEAFNFYGPLAVASSKNQTKEDY